MEVPSLKGQEVAAEVASRVAPEKPPYYNEAIRAAPTAEEAFTVAVHEGQDFRVNAEAAVLAKKDAIKNV